MRIVVAIVALVLGSFGCARSAEPEVPDSDPSSRGGAPTEWEAPAERPKSRVVHRTRPTEVTTIGTVTSEPERVPGSQRRIDVQFHEAELGNVVRMLAHTGNFNVVTGGTLSAKISVDLKRVRPYDALVAIAEANGAVVEQRGEIVFVKGP